MEAQRNTILVQNTKAYVEKKQKTNKIVLAEKNGLVQVKEAVNGQPLEVWTKNGKLETTEIQKEGQMILTRVDKRGIPILDAFGHTNSWAVDKETFQRKYEPANKDGIAKPKGETQSFMQIDEDIIIFVPWGKDGAFIKQSIEAGGFLNITNTDDIYGIAEAEFKETYVIVE